MIANLFLLLTGFALLARHFEDSGVPESLPRVLPGGIAGAFALLAMTFVLSSFLDNIAAALIGATMAKIVFPRVHIGYLAAIVAASNAGGSGSVVGDTTTTMMWIAGVSPVGCAPRLRGGGAGAAGRRAGSPRASSTPTRRCARRRPRLIPSTGAGSASSPRCCWRRWPPTSA